MVDCQCHGNLGFLGFQFLIGIVVTHANILSSIRSTGPRGSCFVANRMLSYHLLTSLRRRTDFRSPELINEQNCRRLGDPSLSQSATCRFRRTPQKVLSTKVYSLRQTKNQFGVGRRGSNPRPPVFRACAFPKICAHVYSQMLYL